LFFHLITGQHRTAGFRASDDGNLVGPHRAGGIGRRRLIEFVERYSVDWHSISRLR